ncbi:MAG: phospholipase D-like domain-containing protein, partial [Mucilaginibacter sp.]
MSSRIIKAKAYTNGEVGYISWQVDSMIHGSLGFEITRVFPDDATQNRKLAAWVPFTGQSNPDWKPQDTGVWPVQKLNWRDLTLIKSRDSMNSREQGFRVQYLVRAVVPETDGLEPVVTTLPVTYTGNPIKLSYVDKGLLTNIITVSTQYGHIRATFTNGILATQALSKILKDQGGAPLTDLKKDIADPTSPVRKYLTGEVLTTLKLLLLKAKANPGSSLKMAIYEFDDEELFETLMDVKDQVEIVLSNTSNSAAPKKPPVWDTENKDFRQKLHDAGVNIHDRFFNNDGHIGHNKFVIYLEKGIPKSVLTGSTNWTPNGLCAQSNNASIIDSDKIAKCYDNYFEALKRDTAMFIVPSPTSGPTKNVQGKDFRNSNIPGNEPVTLDDGTVITAWFSPNTVKTSVDKTVVPPDLSQVYSLMRKAEKAIFFAVFLPGTAAITSPNDIMTNIITEAISIGSLDPSLMVYGAISSPMAMPIEGAPANGAGTAAASGTDKAPAPTTFDKNNVHIIRAFNITS